MTTFERLPTPLQDRIDEAAAKLVSQWGITLAQARELVLEHLVSCSAKPTHGTGH